MNKCYLEIFLKDNAKKYIIQELYELITDALKNSITPDGVNPGWWKCFDHFDHFEYFEHQSTWAPQPYPS